MQWIKVSKQLPLDNGSGISDDVIIHSTIDGGQEAIGFYCYRDDTWTIYEDLWDDYMTEGISHWAIITPPTEGE